VNDKEQELVIRRILVALDASTHSLAALGAAAELAAALRAELIGLFVEDENLLHLAALPFAHEIRSPMATKEPISSDTMEHQMQLQASQARRALKEAAERVKAQWSFRIVRGQVTASVLEAALDADMVAMGRVSHPLHSRSRLGSTARATSTGTEGSVLLMQKDTDLSYPVLVTYDGSQAAWPALAAAAKLARSSGDKLNVLILSKSLEEATPLRDEVSAWLEDHDLTAEFHWLPQPTVNNLAVLTQAAENCVLVLGGDNPLLRAEAIQELLDATDCPVMLVR
jgi:nucleotide-binding universal stress UspA family protein